MVIMTEESCDMLISKAKSTFDRILQESLDDGEPAEFRKSEHDYVMDFEHAEDIMVEAIEEVGKERFRECGIGFDDVMDILEGHRARRINRGDFEGLSREVEEL